MKELNLTPEEFGLLVSSLQSQIVFYETNLPTSELTKDYIDLYNRIIHGNSY